MVPRQKPTELYFEIDSLTNSIRNAVSGDNFATEVTPFTSDGPKHVSKRKGWAFNWKSELEDDGKEVYKLTIVNNSAVIQGLVSITIQADHVYMELLESAFFNRGHAKLYEGVAGNLVAYACTRSFQHGFDGYVSFTAKTKLIEHYVNTLHATLFGGQLMIINTAAARRLINEYFKTE